MRKGMEATKEQCAFREVHTAVAGELGTSPEGAAETDLAVE